MAVTKRVARIAFIFWKCGDIVGFVCVRKIQKLLWAIFAPVGFF